MWHFIKKVGLYPFLTLVVGLLIGSAFLSPAGIVPVKKERSSRSTMAASESQPASVSHHARNLQVGDHNTQNNPTNYTYINNSQGGGGGAGGLNVGIGVGPFSVSTDVPMEPVIEVGKQVVKEAKDQIHRVQMEEATGRQGKYISTEEKRAAQNLSRMWLGDAAEKVVYPEATPQK